MDPRESRKGDGISNWRIDGRQPHFPHGQPKVDSCKGANRGGRGCHPELRSVWSGDKWVLLERRGSPQEPKLRNVCGYLENWECRHERKQSVWGISVPWTHQHMIMLTSPQPYTQTHIYTKHSIWTLITILFYSFSPESYIIEELAAKAIFISTPNNQLPLSLLPQNWFQYVHKMTTFKFYHQWIGVTHCLFSHKDRESNN